MRAYYNEIDPFCAQWLRNLIARGLLPPGDVDERSIKLVSPDDLLGFTQCHFFAGIGIWPHALRAAGWDDARPVWTGSCPCQPFSGAGKGGGFDDPRHLWPDWYRLVKAAHPVSILGEQVDGPAGRAWFDLVCADLEASGYACGQVVFNSASVGAPNIRHRRFWLAHTDRQSQERGRDHGPGQGFGAGEGRARERFAGFCPVGGGLGNARIAGLPDAEPPDFEGAGRGRQGRTVVQPGGPFDPWRELEWIDCRDGKSRPTQPGIFPLAARYPGDVGKLRAYGNALNAIVAQEFVAAVMDVIP